MVCEAGCSQWISDLRIEEKEEMARTFKLEPREVAKVDTKWRKIATKIPVPESIPALEKLRNYAASVWFDESTATDEERNIMDAARAAYLRAIGANIA